MLPCGQWWQLVSFVAWVRTSAAHVDPWCSYSTPQRCESTGAILSNLSCGWCRSWGTSSIIVDNSLRMIGLDGGVLPGDGNSSHNYMVQVLLDRAINLTSGSSWQLSLLPDSVPRLKHVALWSNPSNSTIYDYGGKSVGSDVLGGSEIPTLATESDKWSVNSTLINILRLTNGASVNVPSIGKGFYIGGYQSNSTSSDAPNDGLNHYAPSMLQFDTTTSDANQIDAPFLPVQFGAISYIPVGSSGTLLYFGGESPPNATVAGASGLAVNSWDHVWVYDIENNKWYNQSATGYVAPRTEFCAATVYHEASNSWQIWAIGGADYKTGNVVNTVSILSIPAFHWFTAAPAATRMSFNCQVYGSQIFAIGGRNEYSDIGGDDYDAIAYIYDVNKQASVSTFDPTSTSYTPPASLRTAISLSSAPGGWADSAVQALFMVSATSSTTSTSTGTASPPPTAGQDGSGLSGGAIAGTVIGIVIGSALVVLVIFQLFRRRKARQPEVDGSGQHFLEGKPELDADEAQTKSPHRATELPATRVIHEMNNSARPVEMDTDVRSEHREAERFELGHS